MCSLVSTLTFTTGLNRPMSRLHLLGRSTSIVSVFFTSCEAPPQLLSSLHAQGKPGVLKWAGVGVESGDGR